MNGLIFLQDHQCLATLLQSDYQDWGRPERFQSKGKVVSHEGHNYRIIYKKERHLSACERIGRVFQAFRKMVGVLFCQPTTGKHIWKLLTADREKIRFAVRVLTRPPAGSAGKTAASRRENSKRPLGVSKVHSLPAHVMDATDQTAPPSFRVGSLQGRWQFPSDHLPVGAVIDGHLRVASWNILNGYFNDTKSNPHFYGLETQGLDGSLIDKLNNEMVHALTKYTQREQRTVEEIMGFFARSNPFDIVALQECSKNVIDVLSKRVESTNLGIIINRYQQGQKDFNVILYNKDKFDYIEGSSTLNQQKVFSAKPKRGLMTACLQEKNTKIKYLVTNCHLPGQPGQGAPEDLARACPVNRTSRRVILGDMNFESQEMTSALSDFKRAEHDYNTNISPTCSKKKLYAKLIDHIFVESTSDITALTAAETMEASAGMAKLITEQPSLVSTCA